MYYFSRIKFLPFLIIIFLFWISSSKAEVYFYFDAESGMDDSTLPNPPFCMHECGEDSITEEGKYHSAGGAKQGYKYFYWKTFDNQRSAWTEISYRPTFPITCLLGKTYYLGYFFNFTKIDGKEIWHRTGDSADKGVELMGNGVRWTVSVGHWGNLAANQADKFTVWGGNPTYHLNRSLENYDIYLPNQSGFSASNPIQLEYDKWHSVIMAVKMAADNTGSFIVWINGVKIIEYMNIKTCANTSPTIGYIAMGGTIAQPYYDAPAHLRKYDAMILTDNWQDIIDGGYMTNLPPSKPMGLRIIQ